MDLNLSGKTASVTGGSAGIGLATAKALYNEGVRVAIASRDREKLEKAVSIIQAVFFWQDWDDCRSLLTVDIYKLL